MEKELWTKRQKLCFLSAVIILTVVEFVLHRFTPFMRDDFWYSANLATGEPIRSVADLIESQVWHFNNWGGRSVNHTLLQVIILLGEFAADVLNICATLLLTFMICKAADVQNIFFYALTEAMMICMNADFFDSMFWESGSANYLYSSIWIMAFVITYIREYKDVKKLPLVEIWMPVLALMTGWSNENVGPACCLMAVAVTFYLVKKCGHKLNVWMIEGALFSLAGSCLVILAPGNFVRSDYIEETSLVEFVSLRFWNMVEATGAFLLPVLSFLLIVSFVYFIKGKNKPDALLVTLLGLSLVSHGAMVLSPHYPARATFGVMIFAIAAVVLMLGRLHKQGMVSNRLLIVTGVLFWLSSILELVSTVVII